MKVPGPRELEHAHHYAGFFTGPSTGTGSASVLPMTDEEKAAVTHKPIGFAPPAAPRKRRKR